MRKPNNVIYQKCTEESFYRLWVEFLTPFHKLTPRERDVAARIILQYFRLREAVQDPVILKELLWSQKSRQDIKTSLKMKKSHFQITLAKLRECGFLIDGDINPKYIPHKIDGDSRFTLMIAFDWSAPGAPAMRSSDEE